MSTEQREATERRLIEINRRLGMVNPLETSDESPPELDDNEMDVLYEERDRLMKEVDEDVYEYRPAPVSLSRPGNGCRNGR